MRIPTAPRPSAAEHGFFRTSAPVKRAAVLGFIVTFGLAGCGYHVIDPEHARHVSQERAELLKRQPRPRCEFRTASLDSPAKSAKSQPAATARDGPPDAAALQIKLDYERQCYKHAEIIARERLTKLQTALNKALRQLEVSETR